MNPYSNHRPTVTKRFLKIVCLFIIIGVVFLIMGFQVKGLNPLRTWTLIDNNVWANEGDWRNRTKWVKAEFVEKTHKEIVLLKLKSGKPILISVDKLSEEDRAELVVIDRNWEKAVKFRLGGGLLVFLSFMGLIAVAGGDKGTGCGN